jgi:hypothetical protein
LETPIVLPSVYQTLGNVIKSLSQDKIINLIKDLLAQNGLAFSGSHTGSALKNAAGKVEVMYDSIRYNSAVNLDTTNLKITGDGFYELTTSEVSNGFNLMDSTLVPFQWQFGGSNLIPGKYYIAATFFKTHSGAIYLAGSVQVSNPLLVAALPSVVSSPTITVERQNESLKVGFSVNIFNSNGSALTSVTVSAIDPNTGSAVQSVEHLLTTNELNNSQLIQVLLDNLKNGNQYKVRVEPTNGLGKADETNWYQSTLTYVPFAPIKITIQPFTQVGASTTRFSLDSVFAGDTIKTLLVIGNFLGKTGVESYLQTLTSLQWSVINNGTQIDVSHSALDANDGIVAIVVGQSGEVTSSQFMPQN